MPGSIHNAVRHNKALPLCVILGETGSEREEAAQDGEEATE